MDNEIYKGYIGKIRCDDGDIFKAYVRVTEEVNGFAIWNAAVFHSAYDGMVAWCLSRDAAIEQAVALALDLRNKPSEFIRDDFKKDAA